MKYESNTPMFSKDIVRKPFFVRTGCTDKGDAICPPPPIINGGGIIDIPALLLAALPQRHQTAHLHQELSYKPVKPVVLTMVKK